MKTSITTVGVLNETRDTTWTQVKSVRRIPTWANLLNAALFAPVLFNVYISHAHASGLKCSFSRLIEWPWSTYLKWRIVGYCPSDCSRGTEEDHRKHLDCYSQGRFAADATQTQRGKASYHNATLSTNGFALYDCTKQH